MKQAILAAIIFAAIGWGQSASGQAFEAASIRPRADEHVVSLRFDSGRLIGRNDALFGLITWTWNLKTYQVIGLPKWAEDERYDIDAKAPDDVPVTQESGRKMMESLLAERFHLKTHRETREMPVYDLVVMKGGPKFHESAPDAEPSLYSGGPRAWNRLTVTAGTMAQLANQLSNYPELGRPVIDKTGLAGRYDYTMKSAAGTPSAEVTSQNESTFAALQDQLGLKLGTIEGDHGGSGRRERGSSIRELIPPLIQHKHKKPAAHIRRNMLFPIQHESLRRRGERTNFRVPQRLTCRSLKRFDAPAVAHENHTAGGGERSDIAAGQLMPPDHLAGLIVDRIEEVAVIHRCAAGHAAEPHGPALIGFHQIVDVQAVVFVDIKQSGRQRECRRRIVQNVIIHERAGNGGVLLRIALHLAARIERWLSFSPGEFPTHSYSRGPAWR